MSDIKAICKFSHTPLPHLHPLPLDIVKRVNRIFASNTCNYENLKTALESILPKDNTYRSFNEKYHQLVLLIEKAPDAHLSSLLSLYPSSYKDHLLQNCPDLLEEKITSNFSSFQDTKATHRLDFLLKLEKEKARQALSKLPDFRLKELQEECLLSIEKEKVTFPHFPKAIQLAPCFPLSFINKQYSYIFSNSYEGFLDLENLEGLGSELYFLLAVPHFLEQLAIMLTLESETFINPLLHQFILYLSPDFYPCFFSQTSDKLIYYFFLSLYRMPLASSSELPTCCSALLQSLNLMQKNTLCLWLAQKRKVKLLQLVLHTLPQDKLLYICNHLPLQVWQSTFPLIDIEKQQEALKNLKSWVDDSPLNLHNSICAEAPFSGFLYLKSLKIPSDVHTIIKTLDETSSVQQKACKKLWLLHLPSDLWLSVMKGFSDGIFDSNFLWELMVERQGTVPYDTFENEKQQLTFHLQQSYESLNEQLIEICVINSELQSILASPKLSESLYLEMIDKKPKMPPQKREFYLNKHFLKLCTVSIEKLFFEKQDIDKGPVQKKHKKLPNISTLNEIVRDCEQALETHKELFKQLEKKALYPSTSKEKWLDIDKDIDKVEKMLQLQKTLSFFDITPTELNENGTDLDELIDEHHLYLKAHFEKKNIKSKQAFFQYFSSS